MSNTRKPVETVYCHQPDLRHQGGRYTWCGIDRTAHDMRPMSTLPEGYRWESCPVCEAMMLLDQAQRETQRRSRTSTWVQGTLFDGGRLAMSIKVTRLKAPESYTSFEPGVDVSAERECASRIARDCLSEVATALIEGRKPTVRVPSLDPVFAAVTGRALQTIARNLGTTANQKNEETEKQDEEDGEEAQGCADTPERNRK